MKKTAAPATAALLQIEIRTEPSRREGSDALSQNSDRRAGQSTNRAWMTAAAARCQPFSGDRQHWGASRNLWARNHRLPCSAPSLAELIKQRPDAAAASTRVVSSSGRVNCNMWSACARTVMRWAPGISRARRWLPAPRYAWSSLPTTIHTNPMISTNKAAPTVLRTRLISR